MSNDRYSVDFAGPMLPAMLHALMLARNTAMMCQAPGLMDAFQEKFDALAAQAGIPDLLILVNERAWFSACEALPKATAFHWYVHTGWSGDDGTPSLIVDGTEHKVAGHELRTDHPQFPAIRDFLERYANPAVTRGEDEVAALPRQRRGERASDGEAIGIGRRGAEHVAVAQEGKQRLDRMIAVGAALADMERQIDLGRRRLDDHRPISASPGRRRDHRRSWQAAAPFARRPR